MANSLKINVNTIVFERFAGCARERKSYQANIKNDTKSIPKPMKNQYRICARKNDAPIIVNGWKMEAELEPQSTKCKKKRDPKINAEKGASEKVKIMHIVYIF